MGTDNLGKYEYLVANKVKIFEFDSNGKMKFNFYQNNEMRRTKPKGIIGIDFQEQAGSPTTALRGDLFIENTNKDVFDTDQYDVAIIVDGVKHTSDIDGDYTYKIQHHKKYWSHSTKSGMQISPKKDDKTMYNIMHMLNLDGRVYRLLFGLDETGSPPNKCVFEEKS